MFYSWYSASKNKNQVFSIQYYIRYFVLTLVDRHDIHHVQVCSSHYQVLWTEIIIFLESKSITLDKTNPKRCLPNHKIVSIKYQFPLLLGFWDRLSEIACPGLMNGDPLTPVLFGIENIITFFTLSKVIFPSWNNMKLN